MILSNFLDSLTVFFRIFSQNLGSSTVIDVSALLEINFDLLKLYDPLIKEYFAILEFFSKIYSILSSKYESVAFSSSLINPKIPFFNKTSISYLLNFLLLSDSTVAGSLFPFSLFSLFSFPTPHLVLCPLLVLPNALRSFGARPVF